MSSITGIKEVDKFVDRLCKYPSSVMVQDNYHNRSVDITISLCIATTGIEARHTIAIGIEAIEEVCRTRSSPIAYLFDNNVGMRYSTCIREAIQDPDIVVELTKVGSLLHLLGYNLDNLSWYMLQRLHGEDSISIEVEFVDSEYCPYYEIVFRGKDHQDYYRLTEEEAYRILRRHVDKSMRTPLDVVNLLEELLTPTLIKNYAHPYVSTRTLPDEEEKKIPVVRLIRSE